MSKLLKRRRTLALVEGLESRRLLAASLRVTVLPTAAYLRPGDIDKPAMRLRMDAIGKAAELRQITLWPHSGDFSRWSAADLYWDANANGKVDGPDKHIRPGSLTAKDEGNVNFNRFVRGKLDVLHIVKPGTSAYFLVTADIKSDAQPMITRFTVGEVQGTYAGTAVKVTYSRPLVKVQILKSLTVASARPAVDIFGDTKIAA